MKYHKVKRPFLKELVRMAKGYLDFEIGIRLPEETGELENQRRQLNEWAKKRRIK